MSSRILDLAYQQIRAQQEEAKESSESGEDLSLQFQNVEMREVPPELIDVLDQRVLKLSFNHNLLRTVPFLPNLSRLFYLDLSENQFTQVPPAICELRSLEILDLSQNSITRLPRELANLQSLKVLSLSHNKLHHLPLMLTELSALEYIEVEDNPLVFPGPDILRLAEEQDDWLPALREHLMANKDTLERLKAVHDSSASQTGHSQSSSASSLASSVTTDPPYLERSRSSSEGYVSRRNKRMGFLMQRNTSGNSYMAALHARGLSVDSSLVDAKQEGPVSPAHLGGEWASAADLGQTALSSRSDSAISLPSPRESPVVFGTPTGKADGDVPEPSESPSPSEILTSRLSTLQEEDDDSELSQLPPKVPQKSQNRSRVNSASTTAESLGQPAGLPSQPNVPEPIPSGYIKMNRALTGFVEAVGDFGLTHCPRYSALMNACREAMDGLVHALETDRDLSGASHRAVTSTLELVAFLNTPAVLEQLVHSTQLDKVRSLVLQLVRSFADLSNANREFESPPPQRQSSALQNLAGSAQLADLRDAQLSVKLAHADEQLYLQLEHAVKTLQIVVSLFNTAIARSAAATAEESGTGTGESSKSGLVAYVGELSSACIDCVAMIRQLKQSLDHRGDRGIVDRRAFWDDVNSFLKSIVSLLAAAKSAVVDLPLLADSGAEMSALARVAKEVPPLLEQSSYKLHLDSNIRLERPRMASAVSSAGPGTTTPFAAAIGAEAQEFLSPGLLTPFEGNLV